MEHPGATVKEFQIATEVFGRPSDFDPRMDSTVRVQTGRLRSKLAEYYSGTGMDDPIIVELPKGSYAVTFHPRLAAPPPTSLPSGIAIPETPLTLPRPEAESSRSVSQTLIGALVLMSIALLAAIVVIAYLVGNRSGRQGTQTAQASNIESLRSFWRSFIDQTEDPLVVFSNAEFTGRPETGVRYFDPLRDSRSQIIDHYTGVGEVLGIHELDRLFGKLNHGLRVKRGRLLSLDDAKSNDVVFVGSPSENLSLLEVPTSQEFVFRRTEDTLRRGDLAIINLHPKAHEEQIYYATAGVPLTEDFAIIALVPGMNPAHQAMLLAGITTIGTQASVEYVCRTESVETILRRLTGSKAGAVSPFEAVLRVKVSHGVPVATQIVAFHTR